MRSKFISYLPNHYQSSSSGLLRTSSTSRTLGGCNGLRTQLQNISVSGQANKCGILSFRGIQLLYNTNFARYCSSSSQDDDGNSDKSGNYKSFTDNDCNSEENQTYGQPLHRFGSSQKLEQSATRFDVQFNENPPVNDYQSDLAAEHVVDVYQHSSGVSLSACMQSQVPQPYGKSPTHMNMPGGGRPREVSYNLLWVVHFFAMTCHSVQTFLTQSHTEAMRFVFCYFILDASIRHVAYHLLWFHTNYVPNVE